MYTAKIPHQGYCQSIEFAVSKHHQPFLGKEGRDQQTHNFPLAQVGRLHDTAIKHQHKYNNSSSTNDLTKLAQKLYFK